ncbi:uncharacterized protein [Epargyreus clarus]|uniref:uncharacterized protein n=1 Tax=Epargyreus clarus TaxID=520877 RepID=UPI003C2D1DD0
MYCESACLGADGALENMRAMNERLNAMVLDQVSGSQELVMMNGFARECSEYRYKKSLQERISEVASWRWVLSDLSKRLQESIEALQHEHNALRVVVQRVEKEINNHCRENSRPGAMSPLYDQVEETIIEEFKFLRGQKRKFEKMIPDVDKQTTMLEKTKKKIVADILNKELAISVDENTEQNSANVKDWKKKRKKGLPIKHWEKRCGALKRAGLRALANAIITRQQVRGARVQLSIAAQSYAAKVDSALRRRLHANKIKLQDLEWQREEALIDHKCLGEELTTTEQSLLETMDQERLVEARLAQRTRRPGKELIKDDVNRQLGDELLQIQQFNKQLRSNMERISSLQNDLADAVARIDCCAEDLIQVIRLDEDRIRSRVGEDGGNASPAEPPREDGLEVILEEGEDDEDDYPFDC